MKILVYGLQSSGATLATFLLGQKSGSVVVPDLYDNAIVPSLDDVPSDVERKVVKSVVTTHYSLDDHETSFCPDKTVLLLRHPGSNFVSLNQKPYRDRMGSIEEKFQLLEAYFNDRTRFDAVVRYEDLVLRQSAFTASLADAGIEVDPFHYNIPRSRLSILKENADQSPWCRENFQQTWGLGNLKSDKIESKYALKHVPESIVEKVGNLCPSVQNHYKSYRVPPLAKFRSRFIHDIMKVKIWNNKLKPYINKINNLM